MCFFTYNLVGVPGNAPGPHAPFTRLNFSGCGELNSGLTGIIKPVSGRRESNSDRIHPMDVYYHYTTPRLAYSSGNHDKNQMLGCPRNWVFFVIGQERFVIKKARETFGFKQSAAQAVMRTGFFGQTAIHQNFIQRKS